MSNIDWPHVARATVWTILAVLAYAGVVLLIARWVAWVSARNERVDRQRQREIERQRALLRIAETIECAPEHEKQRLQRTAEALGFMDELPPIERMPKNAA